MSPRDPLALPDAIVALGPDVAQDVQRLVAQAERRQDAELVAALEKGLAAVPWPLRGLARKVLVG